MQQLKNLFKMVQIQVTYKNILKILDNISVYYFLLFFKYHTQNNKFGIQNKLRFTLHFKEREDSKKIKPIIRTAATNEMPMNDLLKLSKEPQNYN